MYPMDPSMQDPMQQPQTPPDNALAPMGDNPIENPEQAKPLGDTDNAAAKKFISETISDIDKDLAHFDKSFKRMVEDQEFADGKQWDGEEKYKDDGNYTINFVQNVIRQRVAALYAKNPTVEVKRRERLDFRIWDGKPQSLQEALQNPMDPLNMALIQDIQQGRQSREQYDRVGKTLEIAFNYDLKRQYPDFKRQMKQFIRREETCGVAYLKLDFQRMLEVRPDIEAKIADLSTQLSQLEYLLNKQAYDGADQDSADSERIRIEMKSLEEQKYKIAREGLIYNFPRSTSIIPHRDTTQLEGWVGCPRVTERYFLSTADVERIYKVDCSKIGGSSGGNTDGNQPTQVVNVNSQKSKDQRNIGKREVFEVYDFNLGTVYTIMRGYDDYLRAPAAPKIMLERFFPYFPLALNERENEMDLFPPSTCRLLRHIQMERNRNKEALRQHRIAMAPKYAGLSGAFSPEDRAKLGKAPPHHIVWFDSLQPGQKLADVFGMIETKNIDPNVYEVGSMHEDVSMVVGMQEANLSTISGATATETTIAEDSRVSSMSSSTDDLDDFLSEVVKEAGQVMLLEMSKDTIQKIVGPGAAWAEFSPEDVINDIYLDIRAGSSGKPNKAMRISAVERLYPVLVQTPGIKPEWLAGLLVNLVDDTIDLSDAYLEGLPSIQALNGMIQAAAASPGMPPGASPGANAGPPPSGHGSMGAQTTGNPMTDPNAQGAMGAMKTPGAPAPQNIMGVNRGMQQ